MVFGAWFGGFGAWFGGFGAWFGGFGAWFGGFWGINICFLGDSKEGLK